MQGDLSPSPQSVPSGILPHREASRVRFPDPLLVIVMLRSYCNQSVATINLNLSLSLNLSISLSLNLSLSQVGTRTYRQFDRRRGSSSRNRRRTDRSCPVDLPGSPP